MHTVMREGPSRRITMAQTQVLATHSGGLILCWEMGSGFLNSYLRRTQKITGATANNRYELWKMGITHILNAAHGNRFCEGNSDFYSASIAYHGVPAYDVPDFDMSKYFNSASAFIHQALNTSGARLLVHCVVGISRSATLVLAYLMIYHQMTLTQAIQRVQENRWVSPNPGFLRQLLKLDGELCKSRHNQGKILVHCVLGKSRSATLVLAYLMIYQHFSLEDAIRHVAKRRCIAPNRGFLEQLQSLEAEQHSRLWRCNIL
uniref:Dual specificity phosphatase 13 n=1 Tax=Xenopus tropicalis TaxID=8364 RepID=A0A803KA67_XENTR